MDTRERAEAFAKYVGLELKGRIISQGFTAVRVAEASGRSPAAFNRWLNGKAEIPLVALCEACEIIGVEPKFIVETAYDRMVFSLGELSGETYDADGELVAPADDQGEGGDVVHGRFSHLGGGTFAHDAAAHQSEGSFLDEAIATEEQP